MLGKLNNGLLVLLFALLLAPLLPAVVMSFSADSYLSFPLRVGAHAGTRR